MGCTASGEVGGGSGLRLYFYIALLTAAVSILFANDSAVLILTPIVLEIVTCLGIDKKGKLAYLFTAGLIADTAAMPLITSNPINILSADLLQVQLHRPPDFHGTSGSGGSSKQFAVDLPVFPKTEFPKPTT